MKKLPFMITLLVLAAMILSACASSGSNDQSNNAYGTGRAAGTPEAAGTPSAIVTQSAAGAPGAATSTAATPNPFGTGTPGEAMTATASTGSASGASTPATTGTPGVQPVGTGTPGGEGTPGAFLPNTGGSNTGTNICRTDRFSNIVDGMKVLDAQNNEIGKVSGVVLLRDSKTFAANNASATVLPGTATAVPGTSSPESGATSGRSSNDNGKTNTNNGNGNGQGNSKGKNPVAATASANGKAHSASNNNNVAAANATATNDSTNAAGANGSTGVVKVANSLQPMIDYLIVNVEKDASGNNVSGKTVLVPYSAFGSQVTNPANGICGLVIKNQAVNLANAPTIDANHMPDMTAAGWDQSYRSFWAQQGLSIPVTGTANSQYVPAVFTSKVEDIKVTNPSKDDLGTIKDFIVNPQTGHFTYAVVQTGGLLGIGSKYIFVPVTDMAWVGSGKNDASDHGTMLLNLTKDQLQKAPNFDDPNQVDTTAANWDQAIKDYWQSLTGTTSSQNTAPPPSR